ncbi:lipase domain protein [Trypanosoma brucei equiperdum]|uniref:Lipase domain protein n=1 Tax=Trypanosoma brucei equiperdum TaxID=630700 RepID=A0A3L6LGW3_9TRYP|nr:lipase domain protein [Trypanosoma brucei equiperdum]
MERRQAGGNLLDSMNSASVHVNDLPAEFPRFPPQTISTGVASQSHRKKPPASGPPMNGSHSFSRHTNTGTVPAIPRAPRRCRLTNNAPFPDPACVDCQRHSCSRHSGGSTLAGGVELQIEGLTRFVWRCICFLWLAALVAGIVLQSLPSITWRVLDICGRDAPDMWKYGTWNSNCATIELEDRHTDTYRVQWNGRPYSVDFGDPLLRFRSLVIDLASPDDWEVFHPDERRFTLRVAIPFMEENSNWSTAPLPIVCRRGDDRCVYINLPPGAVLNDTGGGRVSLSLSDVPGSIARNINNSAVGILFQGRAYALTVLIWRYIALTITVLHTIRFVVNLKYNNSLYEQWWVLVLLLASVLYLNPLTALAISPDRLPLPLEFLELHVPWWFVAVVVSYMFSVITASMPRAANPTKQEGAKNLGCLSRMKACFCRSRSIYDPPLWTKVVGVLFIIIAIGLDIAVAWRCCSATLHGRGSGKKIYIYLLCSLFGFGSLVCCIMLYRLRRSMSKKSYLDSRPQQLACRVFMFMFFTAIIFSITQFALFYVLDFRIPGMLAWQPLIQLPALLVWPVLVNVMTLIYTTRHRPETVPIHPRDTRWKESVWPDDWYRWLARHGGSMYIFHTEKEEASFNWKQLEYRVRRYLVRLKRRGGVHNLSLLLQSIPNDSSSPPVEGPSDPSINYTIMCSVHSRPQDIEFWKGLRESICNRGAAEIVNMDMTSTCFLPYVEAGRENDLGPERPSGASQVMRQNVGREGGGSRAPLLENDGGALNGSVALRLSSTTGDAPPGDGERRLGSVDDHSGGNGDDGGSTNNPKSVWQALRGVISASVRGAGRNLFERPAHAFERAETYLLDAVQQRMHEPLYLPFFNLETAIDCFNIAFESYNWKGQSHARAQERKVGTSGCCRGSSNYRSNARESAAYPRETNPDACTTSQGDVEMRKFCPSTEQQSVAATPDHNGTPTIDVEQYGYKPIAVFEALDVAAVCAVMDTEFLHHRGKAPRIVIAFRGTANMSNVREDIKMRRRAWDEMKNDRDNASLNSSCCWEPTVHSGFLEIWEAHQTSIEEKLGGFLKENSSTVYRVFCTGHSMGGAVACLCAYSVRRMLREIEYPLDEVTVYTFGQPPMGNAAFQTAYDKAIPRTFRVVNESDEIATFRLYGTQVGTEVDINRHGNYICKPTYMEQRCHPMKNKVLGIEGHQVKSYARSLNALALDTSCKIRASGDPEASYVAEPGREPDAM